MIETTYIQISKAAELLQTNIDALLIAAIESRIKLYAPVGEMLEVLSIDGEISELKWFSVISLTARDAVALLKYGVVEPTVLFVDWKEGVPLDDSPTPTGRSTYHEVFWPHPEGCFHFEKGDLLISTEVVNAIIRDRKTPNEQTYQDPPVRQSAITKRNDTLHIIIAALAKQAQIDLDNRDAASRIEGCVTRLGASISPGTTAGVIKEVLERIPESLERRKKL